MVRLLLLLWVLHLLSFDLSRFSCFFFYYRMEESLSDIAKYSCITFYYFAFILGERRIQERVAFYCEFSPLLPLLFPCLRRLTLEFFYFSFFQFFQFFSRFSPFSFSFSFSFSFPCSPRPTAPASSLSLPFLRLPLWSTFLPSSTVLLEGRGFNTLSDLLLISGGLGSRVRCSLRGRDWFLLLFFFSWGCFLECDFSVVLDFLRSSLREVTIKFFRFLPREGSLRGDAEILLSRFRPLLLRAPPESYCTRFMQVNSFSKSSEVSRPWLPRFTSEDMPYYVYWQTVITSPPLGGTL